MYSYLSYVCKLSNNNALWDTVPSLLTEIKMASSRKRVHTEGSLNKCTKLQPWAYNQWTFYNFSVISCH